MTQWPRPDRDAETKRILDPYYWIDGECEDGSWQPLYCYESGREARGVLRMLLDLDQAGGYHEQFTDFRLRPPEARSITERRALMERR